jgi:Mg2+ and Co2+ transporter CorA
VLLSISPTHPATPDIAQLYSLISQQDARLQYRLAREAVKDSKAMKTLSVITILFLPGAFMATLFSTNMFTFDEGQEVRIFFGVFVPLTVVIMAIWLWWIRTTPYGTDKTDEEAAAAAAAV